MKTMMTKPHKFFCISMIVLMIGVFPACNKVEDPFPVPGTSLKIKRLELRSLNVAASANFWESKFGFPVVYATPSNPRIQIGNTELSFRPHITGPKPVYRFAFEIPENQIEQAFFWLKEANIEVLKHPENGREIQHVPRLNAHSIAFIDGMGNLVELIAKHDLKNSSEEPFTRASLLGINEIGVVSFNIQKAVDLVKSELNVDEMTGYGAGYKPLGGREGQLHMVVPKRPWLPYDINSVNIPMLITVQYPQVKEFALPGSLAVIRTEP